MDNIDYVNVYVVYIIHVFTCLSLWSCLLVNHLDLFRDESTLSEVIIRATRTIQTRYYTLAIGIT